MRSVFKGKYNRPVNTTRLTDQVIITNNDPFMLKKDDMHLR